VRAVNVKQDEIPSGLSAAQYAQELLAMHAVPGYSIQVSGADLLALTGEPWDWIKLGAKCVVETPDAGKIIETVVSISWPDALNQPQRIRVSLATQMPKVSMGLASAIKVADVLRATSRGGRGGGGGKTQKDNTYWGKILSDTIEAAEGAGLKQLWQSGIEVGARTGARIFSLYNGMEALDSEIIVNTGRISAEVTRASAAENALSGRITVEAGKIALVVDETSGGNVIKAASIVAAINEAGSDVIISADHIHLDGETIAKSIFGQSITVAGLSVTSSAHFETDVDIMDDLLVGADLTVQGDLTVGTKQATWQNKTVVTSVTCTLPSINLYSGRYYATTASETSTTVTGAHRGRLVSSADAGSFNATTSTINYLGYA
jgi:hypothetical protein